MHALKAFLLVLLAGSGEEPNDPHSLSCSGKSGLRGPVSTFAVTVDFGRGGALSVLNPDGRARLGYWNDVATGEMQRSDTEGEPMVWTVATSDRGTLMGHGIRSDGSLFSITIRHSIEGAPRHFVLFDTATGTLMRGQCRS
jgi:hypothetical protein